MKYFKKMQSAYWVTWKLIHVVALVAFLAIIVLSCCGFGMGPGLNPPLDIHVPTAEEFSMEQKEHEGGNADHLQPERESDVYIEYPDSFHSLV